MTVPVTQIGLERCIADPVRALQGARFGLLANQASLDHRHRYSWDVLHQSLDGKLAAIFSPQHGLWCEQQANMIESPDSWLDSLQVPVYSLYSETRSPTDAMLDGLDCLVIDLQDVGTRVYTFAWTILHCLQACGRRGIPVVVLDRPNPLGGVQVDGPLLEPGFTSFVGELSIPMKHGLTLAELARLSVLEQSIDVELITIPMAGWSRTMTWRDTGRSWSAPSPNMPTESTTVVYPGQVLLEGTNLSEGRGTTIPFEICGAPFVDARELVDHLRRLALPGIHFRELRFVPTFDKWKGQSCQGVAFHITDEAEFRPFLTSIALLAAVAEQSGDAFAWLPPPYEYERDHLPIDILYGSDHLRRALTERSGSGRSIQRDELLQWSRVDTTAWWQRVAEILLYD